MSNNWFVERAPPPSNQWASHGTTSKRLDHGWFRDGGYPLKNVNESGSELSASGYKLQSESVFDAKDTSFAQLVQEGKAKAREQEFRKALKQASYRNSGLESSAHVKNLTDVEWDPIMGEYRTASQNRHRRENTPISLPPLSETSTAPLTTHQAPCFSTTPTGPIIMDHDSTAYPSHKSPGFSGKYRISVPDQPYGIATWDDNRVRSSSERPATEVKSERAPSSLVASVDVGPFCDCCGNNARWCMCSVLDATDRTARNKGAASQKDADSPFTAEDDETLKRMKGENKSWAQIIGVLNRSKTVLQARYKEIKDDNDARWGMGSFLGNSEKPSRKKQTMTSEIAPVLNDRICEHCGETFTWCNCSHSFESGKSTRQKNNAKNGWGDDDSSYVTHGRWERLVERQNNPQSHFQPATAKTESEASVSQPARVFDMALCWEHGMRDCGWCNLSHGTRASVSCRCNWGDGDKFCQLHNLKAVKKAEGGDAWSDKASSAGWGNGGHRSDPWAYSGSLAEVKRVSGRGDNCDFWACEGGCRTGSVKSGGGWSNAGDRAARNKKSNLGGGWDNNSDTGKGWDNLVYYRREPWDAEPVSDNAHGGWSNHKNATPNQAGQQPAGVNATTAGFYEDHIRALQHQLQEQAAILCSYQQAHPINHTTPQQWENNSTPSIPSSRISNGQATGLRKEAAFLRERLASDNLSPEDRQKAIEVLHIIEGGQSEPSITTTAKDNGDSAKSTTFNVSSNGHDNASASLALDLKMHDLTKTITKMKAFDKFQHMQQDTDRLARIEEKLSKSKDKTKESDRVSAFQKRTAREVERLNRRFDELLTKDTWRSNPSKQGEIEHLKMTLENLTARCDEFQWNIDVLSDKHARLQKRDNKDGLVNDAATSEAASFLNPKPTRTRTPRQTESTQDAFQQGKEGKESKQGMSRPDCICFDGDADDWCPLCHGPRPWSNDGDPSLLFTPQPPNYNDSPFCTNAAFGSNSSFLSGDGLAYVPPNSDSTCIDCVQIGGWSLCPKHRAPSNLSSGWTIPGKVATVTSSVNEDCGPIQAFNRKKDSSPGVPTPPSSWDRCDIGSRKSYEGTKGKGKTPTNDGGSVVSLFF